jgi:hypothetical protein
MAGQVWRFSKISGLEGSWGSHLVNIVNIHDTGVVIFKLNDFKPICADELVADAWEGAILPASPTIGAFFREREIGRH